MPTDEDLKKVEDVNVEEFKKVVDEANLKTENEKLSKENAELKNDLKLLKDKRADKIKSLTQENADLKAKLGALNAEHASLKDSLKDAVLVRESSASSIEIGRICTAQQIWEDVRNRGIDPEQEVAVVTRKK